MMTALTNKHDSGHCSPQGHRTRGQPKNTWKRDLEKEMSTAGFKYSWRKMEAAAQDRAGWRQVVCGQASLGASRLKSSCGNHCGSKRWRNWVQEFAIILKFLLFQHTFIIANVFSGLELFDVDCVILDSVS